MSFFRSKTSRTETQQPSSYGQPQDAMYSSYQTVSDEVLLQIHGCRAHLINGSEAVELAAGDFELVQVLDNNVALAMVVRIGRDLQWPVIKDEPVVKLDSRDYLFTLPVKDGEPLSYGGTGHIIRGMFKCSNAYTNQVHKGGEIMITKAEKKSGASSKRSATTNKNQINKNLQRVRKLSRATEKLSKTMLNGVGVVSGSVMGPVVKSKPGKAFFSMVPGEVLLASLDALNKLLDAAEAAERQTLSATSKATTRMVSER
ncbi:Senescence/spartin-associated [Arabidopsis suecica]|nr:Senescence/spartin-associated [Arabidopsis suecica]